MAHLFLVLTVLNTASRFWVEDTYLGWMVCDRYTFKKVVEWENFSSSKPRESIINRNVSEGIPEEH